MNLSRARQQVKDPGLRETLDGTDGILLEAVESSRTLAIELCPPALYELGLVPALQWLGKRMFEQHELEVRIDADLHEEMQDQDLRSFCFEAVRELLFNVVKHSGVCRARVDLQRSGDFLRIDVSDAGVGFDPRGLCPSDTESLEFGLLTIRERFSSLGGRVDVESAPGAGTRISLFAPWKQAGMDLSRPGRGLKRVAADDVRSEGGPSSP
jgi:signal transduction histidine kinase